MLPPTQITTPRSSLFHAETHGHPHSHSSPTPSSHELFSVAGSICFHFRTALGVISSSSANNRVKLAVSRSHQLNSSFALSAAPKCTASTIWLHANLQKMQRSTRSTSASTSEHFLSLSLEEAELQFFAKFYVATYAALSTVCIDSISIRLIANFMWCMLARYAPMGSARFLNHSSIERRKDSGSIHPQPCTILL